MPPELIADILWKVLFAVIFVVVIMTFAAYSVLAERKVASWIQGRVGPNRTALPGLSAIPVIGPHLVKMGIWQPLADGVKFLFKEDPIPGHVNKLYYCLAPAIALIPALTTMVVLPVGQYTVDGIAHPIVLANIDIGILFILAVSSLGVYGIVIGGWAANSKYPYFGGIRSSAQMISYELAMGMSILPVFMWANGTEPGLGGLSLFNVVTSQQAMWLGVWMPVPAFIFLTALFAETNRLPFDMPESETELVGGFHTEYGSFKFGLFFVGEYAHMVIGSAVFTILFLGGWNFLPDFGIDGLEWLSDPWSRMGWFGSVLSVLYFIAKTMFFVFFFMWVRWTLPRFRYDQVMNLGWKYLVPAALACIFIYALIIGLIDIAFAVEETPAIVQ
ncbi:complex I subunit 1/NuoH family protein [Cerasicoccus arenae]|uniref:NADH-quinone oxidoreductase subunit H n=1 Tax=Cerasicoccus arenae TaxID=424488 RepID=A0A8J3DIN9_9BACT|nr:complex I subunit 1 family protein [Cerasicoccus arenae]MBK1856629.1 NADH-quinone oxidoreductase subunit H [Cerasicoccus arenae]GHC12355.1 NADH-quinone oxidoreductase subunit H [Cerasicoccus arenae]